MAMKTKATSTLLSLCITTAISVSTLGSSAMAQDKITIRMSTPASETDFRSQGLANQFAEGISEFATYEPHYNDWTDGLLERINAIQ